MLQCSLHAPRLSFAQKCWVPPPYRIVRSWLASLGVEWGDGWPLSGGSEGQMLRNIWLKTDNAKGHNITIEFVLGSKTVKVLVALSGNTMQLMAKPGRFPESLLSLWWKQDIFEGNCSLGLDPRIFTHFCFHYNFAPIKARLMKFCTIILWYPKESIKKNHEIWAIYGTSLLSKLINVYFRLGLDMWLLEH